jgi:hypothetical protein
MSDDPNEFLRQSRISGYPNAKFERLGDTASGTIKGTPRVIDSQYGKALVIDLINDQYPEGGITLWVKAGIMASALADAVGDGKLEEGGKLQVTFSGERDTGKPSKLKEYDVRYEAPTPAVDVNAIFGDG